MENKSKDTIIIIRHGKSALSRKVWLTWRGYQSWWREYDSHGLEGEQKIPKKLLARVDPAGVVISSPLPRAVETAKRLFGRVPDQLDSDLLEAALPPPHLWGIKLRPKTWGALSRVAWYGGWSDGMESHAQARARAETMCDKLDDYAGEGKTVFITAHGWFNRMLKGSLQKRGWKCVSQNGELHWNHRRFERQTGYEEKVIRKIYE